MIERNRPLDERGRNNPSRRAVLTSGALGLAALGLAGCESQHKPAPTTTPTEARGAATTLHARLVAGERVSKRLPYRRLATETGIPLQVREELCHAKAGRTSTRKALVAFGHITDTHIIDPTSPAQTTLTFLQNPGYVAKRQTWYFRPQDSLTVQVMDAMVRKLNAVAAGPVTGRPFDFHVSTGDSSDNRGMNEVSAFIDIMNGRKTSAFAFPGSYEGLQSPMELPPAFARFIWQPVPSKRTTESRVWQDRYGFPVAPAMLSSASAAVTTEGSHVPWYSGFGNHDQMVHDGTGPLGTAIGNFYEALATSGKLITGLPKGDNQAAFEDRLLSSTQQQMPALIADMQGPTVRASAKRREVTKSEFMSAHWVDPGPQGPAGHGFTAENVRTGNAYYRFRVAEGIVGLMLDTTDPTGGNGSLDSQQAAWLEEQLASVSSVRYDASGAKIVQDVPDQLVVIFSHHPSVVFGLRARKSPDAGALESPEAVQDLLGRFPNVIAWVNGHLHKNELWARRSSHGDHGFWEINTASHIDFPQQTRTVEVIDNRDGTLSIGVVMVDHSEPLHLDYAKRFTAAQLAAFSAELSLNKPGLDVAARTASGQNAELLLKKPF